jgi:hypothetical protein
LKVVEGQASTGWVVVHDRDGVVVEDLASHVDDRKVAAVGGFLHLLAGESADHAIAFPAAGESRQFARFPIKNGDRPSWITANPSSDSIHDAPAKPVKGLYQ